MNIPTPVSRVAEIVVMDVKEETLVYDLRVSKAHCLNHTAAFVWKSCDGRNTVPDICRLLEREYKVPVSEDFVWLALDQLRDSALLTDNFPSRANSTSASRREMLKRVGIVSMIAAPIVASIVAPVSTFAGGSCICMNPGNCLVQTTCPSTSNCNSLGICAP